MQLYGKRERIQLTFGWMLQILASTIYIVIGSLFLSAALYARSHQDEIEQASDYYGYTPQDLLDYACGSTEALLAFAATTIILNFTEIGLFFRGRLLPKLLLGSACIKTLVWFVYFLLAIVSAAIVSDVSISDIALSIFLLLSSILQLTMSLGMVRAGRKKQRTNNHDNWSGILPVDTPRDSDVEAETMTLPEYRPTHDPAREKSWMGPAPAYNANVNKPDDERPGPAFA